MTPRAFIAARERLGWSRLRLGNTIGVDEKAIRRWEDGASPIPDPLATWLEAVNDWLRRNPPPTAPFSQTGRGRRP